MNIEIDLPKVLERVDILRHGEIDGVSSANPQFIGSLDTPLSSFGWQHMKEAVNNTSAKWQLIVSSPLQRCSDFANALADKLDIPCIIRHRLREYHFGVWEGRKLAEIALREPGALEQFWADPEAHPPIGAESLLEFKHRVATEWEELVRQSPVQHMLIITHGGVMRMLRCHLQQLPITRFFEYSPAYAERLSVHAAGNFKASAPTALSKRSQLHVTPMG